MGKSARGRGWGALIGGLARGHDDLNRGGPFEISKGSFAIILFTFSISVGYDFGKLKGMKEERRGL